MVHTRTTRVEKRNIVLNTEHKLIIFLVNVHLNLTLERPLTLADKGTLLTLAHDHQTQSATKVVDKLD